jgi:phage terminase large subunit-like protein
MSDSAKTRELFNLLSKDEKLQFLASLSKTAFNSFFYSSNILENYQVVPEGDWSTCLFLAGRGSGKSFTGAEWLASKVRLGHKHLCMVGPTYNDLRRVMVPFFIDRFPADQRPVFLSGNSNTIRCKNGIIVDCLTLDNESSRGVNAEFVWIDEPIKACDGDENKIEERLTILNFAIRIGKAQKFYSTTPKPMKWLKKIVDKHAAGDPSITIMRAKTADNPHLSDKAKRDFYAEYGGTRIGKQELLGILLTDNPDALWTEEVLNKAHITVPGFNKLIKDNVVRMNRTVVALDTAVSTNENSDETGLFVAGLGSDNKVYLLDDLSGKMTPGEWARIAVEQYKKVSANCIVMESNQGGNLLEAAIHNVDPYVKVKLIHAGTGKLTRFEPVVMAYERNEIYHVGDMSRLEDQMLSWNPTAKNQWSPDRIDAAAYAIYELLLNNRGVARRTVRNLGAW